MTEEAVREKGERAFRLPKGHVDKFLAETVEGIPKDVEIRLVENLSDGTIQVVLCSEEFDGTLESSEDILEIIEEGGKLKVKGF